MLHAEDISCSLVQNFFNQSIMQQSHLFSGGATAFNVLSFFLSTPEIVTQVYINLRLDQSFKLSVCIFNIFEKTKFKPKNLACRSYF